MHQVSQLMWWLSSTRGPKVHLHEDADPQDGVEENDCEDVEDDAQAPATDLQAFIAACARNGLLSKCWTTSFA